MLRLAGARPKRSSNILRTTCKRAVSSSASFDFNENGVPDECEAVSIDEPWTGDCDELAVYFEALERCWEG